MVPDGLKSPITILLSYNAKKGGDIYIFWDFWHYNAIIIGKGEHRGLNNNVCFFHKNGNLVPQKMNIFWHFFANHEI